ncbi:hypothetical protein [Natrinema halophilum]|uniref:Uncharacterized protein n=1 Tax=Natrinema halophilum TaxID=1699371 RepID=A0A7D5GGP7_9EURY|nr:hypothetical protein [Natrinema halophilum]QLG48434.1 hypothetical protein HYG82_06015 [Natrinema halophilum]
MSLIVEATDDRTDRSEGYDERGDSAFVDWQTGTRNQQRRIDVTDVHAAGIDEFVRSNVETDAVSLEHRGGRTYLLLED